MPLTQVSSRAIEDTLRYVLGASGTSHYTFTGKGLNGAVNDPTIYLVRGQTYIFENRSGGHPFYIKTSIANGGTNDAYNTGVTNNGGGDGTEIVFTVPHDAPDTLYYQCSSHSSMAGTFKIAGSVADGSITESKLADDAVTADKLADSINTAIAANTAKDLTALSASNLTSGTVPDARFPATLPAASAANLTNVPAANITGNLPAIDGSALTGLSVGRNLAVNGDMRINQKGNTSSTSHGWNIALDAWRTWHYAHGGTCTSSQGTVASGTTPYDLGFRYTYKLAMSGSLTAASNSSAFIANGIEGRNVIRSGWNYKSSSSYLTISFWVKASVAQNYTATVFMQGNRNYGWTFAVSSADTWQKITKTIPGDSSISIPDNENAAAMSFYIFAWIGSDFDNHTAEADWVTYDGDEYSRPANSGWFLSTNPVFEVTGVQIESGSSATPFEWEDFNTTLDKCQRYYVKLTGVGGAGQSYSANSVDGMRWFISWPNKMNSAPTVNRTGGSDGQSNANLAIAQSTADGVTMNLKSTDSNTSVWWYNATIEAYSYL